MTLRSDLDDLGTTVDGLVSAAKFLSDIDPATLVVTIVEQLEEALPDTTERERELVKTAVLHTYNAIVGGAAFATLMPQ